MALVLLLPPFSSLVSLNYSGNAQEPCLCESVLQTVKADQLWIADRNMCTQGFLFGISTASSDFLIREHKTLPQQAISELQSLA